jgi:glycerophosphoryl diester phosphodiesterase
MKIFAHRGASHDALENTMAAFRLGWQQGADGAELDVHLSRDGQIIVCHDPDARRTTGASRVIAKTDAAELRDLPRLDEVIAELPTGSDLLVEVKCGADIVPVLVAARLPPRQVSFLSFNIEVLSAIKSALPDHRCLLNVERQKFDAEKLAALGHGFDGVSLGWHRSINGSLVKAMHAAGLTIAVWTVDSPEVAKAARAADVDILMTNRPREIREALRQEDRNG